MRMITLIVPDDVGLQALSEIISQAKEFHMELLPDDEPKASIPIMAAAKRVRRVRRTRTALSTIMNHSDPGKSFNRLEAKDWLKQEGYSIAGIGHVLRNLIKDGGVKKIGRGEYMFL